MQTAENLAVRLKQARERLGLTQAEAANKSGTPLVSLKRYEASKVIPGGEALIDLAKLGINLHWLLTGEGSMLPQDPPKEAPPVDMDRLAGVIRELEGALTRHHRLLDPDRKARAVTVLYDFYSKAGPQNEATVDRMLDLMT